MNSGAWESLVGSILLILMLIAFGIFIWWDSSWTTIKRRHDRDMRELDERFKSGK